MLRPRLPCRIPSPAAAVALATAAVLAAACDELTGQQPSEYEVFCASCAPGELCVQHFDGPCGVSRMECRPAIAGCTGERCNDVCDEEVCKRGDDVGTCWNGGCPDEVEDAVRCYWP